MIQKKITVIILVLVLTLFFGVYLFFKTQTNHKLLNDFGTARLIADGSEVKILTGKTTNGYGLVFLFLDKQNNIINTLSAENSGLEGPSYRIVKGNNHDWLVITTISEYGTGLKKEMDSWYLVKDTYGGVLKALSYPSLEGDYPAESTSTEITANVSNLNYKNDDALDISFSTKICDKNNVCSKTTKTSHYIWQNNKDDENKSGFVLDQVKSI